MIIITNKGLIDPLALELIGASSKREDNSTIGFFGSGAKYAIAGLLRNDIPFQVWRGETAVDFSVEDVSMRGNTYRRIMIDGRPTSLTTNMGPKWEKWMFIRELYANAIDEGGEMAITDDYQQFIAPDHTTIIIPDTSALDEVMDRQEYYFCRGRAIMHEDERIRIYEDIGAGGFYVKGILVSPDLKSMDGHGYQLMAGSYEISEDRILRNDYAACRATLAAIFKIEDRKVVRRLVSRLRRPKTIECHLLNNFYSFDAVKTSDAWHHVTFFPPEASDYAVSDDHLVVPSCVYERVIHPNKWSTRKWEPAGTDEENNKLAAAMRILDEDGAGRAPSKVSFGRSVSEKLGMGEADGILYVTETLKDLGIDEIAAQVAVMRGISGSQAHLVACLKERYAARC